jgi:uncharacterized C2H2 Zn-finger protein
MENPMTAEVNAPVKKTARGGRRGARKGTFTCPDCGRVFGMAMHLARHAAATHGSRKAAPVVVKIKSKNGRRKRRMGRRAVFATAPALVRNVRGINVDVLSIEQLIALKNVVDNRLSRIALQMREANVRV